MSKRKIIIDGYYATKLEIEETEKGCFITAYGDGEAVMEISKKTFETICKDYDFRIMQKALTPPTADEVCEAFSEHDDFDEVYYDDSTKGFYSNDIAICYLGINHNKTPIIIFEYDLPPHITTLISRFYEGEVK